MNCTILIYLVAEILTITFMHYAKKNRNENKKVYKLFLILSILPFGLLFALRSKYVGKDYLAYANAFESINTNSLSERQSEWLPIGFKFICKVMGFICNNYYITYAMINIITLTILIKTIWDNSKHPTFSLFIMLSFCLHFQIFNQFRQMLAIAITFYAYKYMKNRNMWKYFILIAIAGLIHSTSFIMIPIYFLSSIKLTKKNFAIYLIITIVISFSFDFIKGLLSNTYYGRIYFNGAFDVIETKATFNLLVRCIMLFGTLIFYKKVIKLDESNRYLYNLVIFCTILQILAAKSYIFARLTTYLFIYYILLIPNVCEVLFKEIKRKNTNTTIWILIIIVLIMYQIIYYSSSSGASVGGYETYQTFIKDF